VKEKLVMTLRSKLFAALAIAGTVFAGAALAEDPAGGDYRMMGSDGMRGMTEMRQSMARMMDGCARMMQTARLAPNENQGAPAPEEGKRQ
jgi:hypothetical protein